MKKILKEGRYDQITFKKPASERIPIISTIFYMDGDVQHRLNEVEGVLLAETHKKLVKQHMDQANVNVCSMDLILTQIQAVITLTVALATFFSVNDIYGLRDSLFITAGTTSLTLVFKKNLAKGILWILRQILRTYLRAFTKRLTG